MEGWLGRGMSAEEAEAGLSSSQLEVNKRGEGTWGGHAPEKAREVWHVPEPPPRELHEGPPRL